MHIALGRRRVVAEPSIGWGIRAAVALLGAKRVMTPRLRRRLELTGLCWEEMAPVLARIRGLEAWTRRWQAEAEASAGRGDHKRACAQAFLAHLPLSPFDERKTPLLALMRSCHFADRQERQNTHCERVCFAGGALVGYRETPRTELDPAKPLVVLLPPLASTKEELAVLADPLLQAGHTVLRLDLPGQGESPPPLCRNSEKLLRRALDESGVTEAGGCFVGGISLGAHFALRLAATNPTRVRGMFGVSPPAIVTPEQWARQPAVIWQYLDLYFATQSRQETRKLCLALTLEDVVSQMACPVVLFHARHDSISLPDKARRYRAALAHVPLTDHVLDDRHGCLSQLEGVIGPQLVAWCAEVAGAQECRSFGPVR